MAINLNGWTKIILWLVPIIFVAGGLTVNVRGNSEAIDKMKTCKVEKEIYQRDIARIEDNVDRVEQNAADIERNASRIQAHVAEINGKLEVLLERTK